MNNFRVSNALAIKALQNLPQPPTSLIIGAHSLVQPLHLEFDNENNFTTNTLLYNELKSITLLSITMEEEEKKLFIQALADHQGIQKLQLNGQFFVAHLPKLCIRTNLSQSLLKLYLSNIEIPTKTLQLFTKGLETNSAIEFLHLQDTKIEGNLGICRTVQHLQTLWLYFIPLNYIELFYMARSIQEGINPTERFGKESRDAFGLYMGYEESTLNLSYGIAIPENTSKKQLLRKSCLYLKGIAEKTTMLGRICCTSLSNTGLTSRDLKLFYTSLDKLAIKHVINY